MITILIVNLLIPASLALIPGMLLFTLMLLLSFLSVGLVESLIARSRMSHVPQFIFLMTALSLTAFAVIIFFLNGGF
jgi:hypothetical protein